MKILGLITGRKNSKRIPGKNMLPLGGKPLVEYTWEAAKNSILHDSLMVSTDDEEMLQYFSDKKIACVKRPEWLCRDRTPHLPVVIHAVEMARDNGFNADAVMILQPTSPFRTTWYINEAAQIFDRMELESLVSVDYAGKRNGAIYLFQTKLIFSKEPTFFGKEKGKIFLMDERSSVNIDTLDDWVRAEQML